jgi:DNA-binding NarL/FixJ family response regulator
MVIEEFDIISDDLNWKDTGCELYISCLNCPRERCIEDEPRGRQKMRLSRRSMNMIALKEKGKTAGEIARIFEVSIRTVQRAISLKNRGLRMRND